LRGGKQLEGWSFAAIDADNDAFFELLEELDDKFKLPYRCRPLLIGKNSKLAD
jgi:hypothetical protein